MAYATVTDVQDRLLRQLNTDEQALCNSLLEDAEVIINAYNAYANESAKKLVSVHMVIRAIGSGDIDSMPIGATQGTMSAVGYSQTWTIASGGSVGQLYLDKLDKKLLGVGNRIGAKSPLEGMVTND